MLCYIGSQENINAAINQINQNCGFPAFGTETWATPQEAYEQDFWYFFMPPASGYKTPEVSFTQAQMIANVINVDIAEFNNNWLPPTPP